MAVGQEWAWARRTQEWGERRTLPALLEAYVLYTSGMKGWGRQPPGTTRPRIKVVLELLFREA